MSRAEISQAHEYGGAPPDHSQRPKTFTAFILFNIFCIGSAGVCAALVALGYFLVSGTPEHMGLFSALSDLKIPAPWARRLLIPAFSIGALLGARLWANAMRKSRMVPPRTIRRFVGPL